MYKVENKNIYLNRGDKIAITIRNNSSNFNSGDKINFYICGKGDYTNIIFSKQIEVGNENETVVLELSSKDTKLGEPLKDGKREYYYEIELVEKIESLAEENWPHTTLVGYDDKGPKLFVLYPEATPETEVE